MLKIINDDLLVNHEIDEVESKACAFLINDNKKLLVSNYNGMYFLPCCKINDVKTSIYDLIKEIKEETGKIYNTDDLEELLTLIYYQKDFPKEDGSFVNRLVTTYFYVGKYMGYDEEIEYITDDNYNNLDDLRLRLYHLDELKKVITFNNMNNPRSIYYMRELNEAIQEYVSKHNDLGYKKSKIYKTRMSNKY